MSNDSGLFVNYTQRQSTKQATLPLFEAKMIHLFDNRWASFETDGETNRDCTLIEKQSPDYQILPRHWVPENEVTLRDAKAPKVALEAAKKQDESAVVESLKLWLAGYLIEAQGVGVALEQVEALLGQPIQQFSDDMFASDLSPLGQQAQQMQQSFPLTDIEEDQITTALGQQHEPWPVLWSVLHLRRPKYLLGWRDITNATNERAVIAGVIPLREVGNNLPIIFNDDNIPPEKWDCLVGNLGSLTFDFVARHKVGGTHLNYFIIKQLPVLGPDQFDQAALDFIVPRVLELIYTAIDLNPYAEGLNYHGDPFPFDPERRQQLRCELDAYYAKLYGLTRGDIRHILDPADVMGEDYPSEIFRVLKNKEQKDFGEYRTQRSVLGTWNKLEKGELV